MRAGEKTRKFGMKVSAGKICVVRGFGDDVWHKISRSRVGVVIKLRTNRGELCGESDIIADILVGVFNTCPDCPMLVEVVSDAKLGCAGIRDSNAEVLILVVRDGQIGGYWANAHTVRRQPAPCLSA